MFVPMGRAADRGAPLDSSTARRAAADAALLVLHGLDAETREVMEEGLRRLPEDRNNFV